jgi:hypothetical protein
MGATRSPAPGVVPVRLLMGWPGRAQRLICWTEAGRREARLKEHAMRTSHQKTAGIITTIGIDLGKNTFHLVGFDRRGVIILQQKVSRGQLERRLANIHRTVSTGSPLSAPELTCSGNTWKTGFDPTRTFVPAGERPATSLITASTRTRSPARCAGQQTAINEVLNVISRSEFEGPPDAAAPCDRPRTKDGMRCRS